MAVIFRISVPNPDDILTLFGAGAKARWEHSTDASSWTEGGTEAIVTGTTSYAVEHLAGTTSTYYRTRYSTATPAVAADYSAYSDTFQVSAANAYTDLVGVRLRMKQLNADRGDDAWLQTCIDAVNTFLNNRIGFFCGPSTDTVRTYDGCDSVKNGRRFYVPGGIRTLTTVEIKLLTSDSTWLTVTSGDVVLRPHVSRLPPGCPYLYVQWLDYPTGSYDRFTHGYNNLRLTGTFGWASVPDDLVELADSLVVRTFQTKRSGQADTYGQDALGNPVVSRFMSRLDYEKIDYYRFLMWDVRGGGD